MSNVTSVVMNVFESENFSSRAPCVLIPKIPDTLIKNPETLKNVSKFQSSVQSYLLSRGCGAVAAHANRELLKIAKSTPVCVVREIALPFFGPVVDPQVRLDKLAIEACVTAEHLLRRQRNQQMFRAVRRKRDFGRELFERDTSFFRLDIGGQFDLLEDIAPALCEPIGRREVAALRAGFRVRVRGPFRPDRSGLYDRPFVAVRNLDLLKVLHELLRVKRIERLGLFDHGPREGSYESQSGWKEYKKVHVPKPPVCDNTEASVKKARQVARLLERFEKMRTIVEGHVLEPQGILFGSFNVHGDTRKLIESAMSSLPNVQFKQLDELTEKILHRVDDVNGSFRTMANSGENVAEAASGFFRSLTIMVPLISLIALLILKPSWLKIAVPCSLLYLVGSLIVPESLWDHMKSHFSWFRPETVVSQSMEFDCGVVGDLIASAVTFATLGERDFSSNMIEVNKRMARYASTANGWGKFSEFALGTLEKTLNAILGLFGRDGIKLLKAGVVRVDKWASDVDAYLSGHKLQTSPIDTTTVAALFRLRTEGDSMLQMYRMEPRVKHVLERGIRILDTLCEAGGAAIASGKAVRAEPAVCSIYGNAGTGKTINMHYIATAILAHELPRARIEQLNNRLDAEIWRSPGSKFANGYCNQMIAQFDDFAQTQPTPGQADHDLRKIVDVVNSVPLALDMADVESKGKVFFDSKVVLITTNLKDMATKAASVLICPDAVVRRMGVAVELHVATDWLRAGYAPDTVNCLDIEKFSAANAIRFPTEAFYFTRHDFSNGMPDRNTEHLSCDDLVRLIRDRIAFNARVRTVSGSNSETMVREIFASRFNTSGAMEPQAGLYAHCIVTEEEEFVRNRFREALVFASNAWGAIKAPVVYAGECYIQWLSEHKILAWLSVGSLLPILFLAIRGLVKGFFKMFMPENKSIDNDVMLAVRKFPKDTQESLLKVAKFFRPADFIGFSVGCDGSSHSVKALTAECFDKAKARFLESLPLERASNMPEPRYGVRKIKHVKGAMGEVSLTLQSDTFEGVRLSEYFGDSVDGTHYEGVFEAQSDAAARSVQNICSNATYEIVLERTTGDLERRRIGYTLFLRGNVCVFPNHFVTDFTRYLSTGSILISDFVVISCLSREYSVRYTVGDFLKLRTYVVEDKDLCFMECNTVRLHKDLVHLICNEGDYKGLKTLPVRLDTADFSEVGGVRILRSRSAVGIFRDKVDVMSVSRIVDVVQYPFTCNRGDCGGPLVLEDAKFTQSRKILGIHVAGVSGQPVGVSSTFTQELVLKVCKHFAIPEERYETQGNIVHQDGPMFVPGSFVRLGSCTQVVSTSGLSRLAASKLHGAWSKVNKAPAKLSKFVNSLGVIIEPMAQALKPYSGEVFSYDQDLINSAAHIAMRPLFEATADFERVGCYRVEDSVLGDRLIDESRGIPRKTSAGFPHVLRNIQGKYYFWGCDEEYDLTKPEALLLEKEVHEILSLAKKGVRCEHIFTDFLKDETRTFAKVDAGLTRLISGAPLAYVVAFRCLFMSFTISAQRTRIDNGMGVGINAYTEYDRLAKKLKAKGHCCVAGDFKAFDSSLQPQILNAIRDIINKWYGDDEWSEARRVLWLEVTNSRHLGGLGNCKKTIYEWSHSLPSGHPLTTWVNSMYNLILFVMCWRVIMGPAMLGQFWFYVYICVYGDDNVLSVCEEVVDRFNQHTITTAMAGFHMTYTTESKDDSYVPPYRSITDVTFLKRGFRYEVERGLWLGPLELDSVLSIPYWVRGEKAASEITQQNANRMWLEMSLHDKGVWATYESETMRAVALAFPGFVSDFAFTRMSYQEQVMNGALVWE